MIDLVLLVELDSKCFICDRKKNLKYIDIIDEAKLIKDIRKIKLCNKCLRQKEEWQIHKIHNAAHNLFIESKKTLFSKSDYNLYEEGRLECTKMDDLMELVFGKIIIQNNN